MTHSPRSLAIIPARKGSRGIPRKNLAVLGGVPLIVHTIAAARRSKLIDEIVVSTDDNEIARLARRWDVSVVKRPASVSGPRTPMVDVVEHVLQTLSWKPKEIILLQPTSPFRSESHIDHAMRTYRRSGKRSLVSVSAVWQHPCECYRLDGDRLTPAVRLPKNIARRQDYPQFWYINGAIYICDTSYLIQKRRFFDMKSCLFKMPALVSVDIDEPVHLKFAQSLWDTFPELRRSFRTGLTSKR